MSLLLATPQLLKLKTERFGCDCQLSKRISRAHVSKGIGCACRKSLKSPLRRDNFSHLKSGAWRLQSFFLPTKVGLVERFSSGNDPGCQNERGHEFSERQKCAGKSVS